MKTILSLLVGLTLIASCTKQESQQTETPESSAENSVKIVNVQAEELSLEPFTAYIRLVGEVKAKDDIRYSAEVSGKVIRYYAQEGDRVKAGEAIAKIDDEMLKKDVERMEAVVAAAYENYKRLESIWKNDSIGTEIGYLNAKYNYEQNKASLEQLKIQLRKTTVISPINAVVETHFVKEGELVSAGTPLVRLIGTDKVKVRVGVPANYAAVIHKGDSARVTFDAFADKEYQTEISYVASSIETKSRTFRIEMELPNQNNELKIDMVANVILETARFQEAIVVNQENVFRTENGYEVFLVGKNADGEAIAIARTVTLGPSFNNRVVVTSGLNPGEKLITGGSGNIENASRIAVVTTSKPANMAYAQ